MNAQQLIETVQRLEVQMNNAAQREATLQQRLNDVTTQLQQTVQQQAQQAQHMGAGFQADVGQAFQRLAVSQQELMEAVKSKGDRKVTLVDNKGLAKPDKFTGGEDQFLYWKTRMEAFVTSVFPEMDEVLEWAEERDVEVDAPSIAAAFGSINPAIEKSRMWTPSASRSTPSCRRCARRRVSR